IAVTAFFLVGYVVVWLMGGIKAFDPSSAQYRLNPVLAGPEGITNIAALIPLPGVGILNALSLLTLIGMAVCFLVYFSKSSERVRHVGHLLLRASLIFQVATIGLLFYRINTMGKVGSLIGSDQFYQIGFQLMGKNNRGDWNAAGQPAKA